MAMTTMTQKPPARQEVQPGGETRILIPDMTFKQYATFVGWLRQGSHLRVAFDGKDMELMVTSPNHDCFAELLDIFFKAVVGGLALRYLPLRTTTWIRPEVERGLEADCCYYLVPEKIEKALAALKARVNDVKHYPNPDLAFEVAISPPQADRQAIYAALRVTELWIFDGAVLSIKRLGDDGRYHAAETSGFLPVVPHDFARWLDEDYSDLDAWSQRIRSWAKKTLKKRGQG
jgi:Uma2 family endonuclease